MVFISALLPCNLAAQQVARDASAQSMTNVKDVTGGMKYLLQEDDVATVQLAPGTGGTVATTVNVVQTSNSQFGAHQARSSVKPPLPANGIPPAIPIPSP